MFWQQLTSTRVLLKPGKRKRVSLQTNRPQLYLRSETDLAHGAVRKRKHGNVLKGETHFHLFFFSSFSWELPVLNLCCWRCYSLDDTKQFAPGRAYRSCFAWCWHVPESRALFESIPEIDCEISMTQVGVKFMMLQVNIGTRIFF